MVRNRRLLMLLVLIALLGLSIFLMAQTYRDSYQRAEHAIQTRQAQTQETLDAPR